ncbi:MAG: DNA methyltransferase [Acidimicrobiia bacterium]
MARIEDLIEEIADPVLRDQIARQIKLLKTNKRFGLVFEDHVPETVSLPGLPIRPGSIVQNRRKPEETNRLHVLSIEGVQARVAPVGADEPVELIDLADLLVVKAFEEPIFPGLTPVGDVLRGPSDKPAHTVISGENFHALQLLTYTHAGKVDVIYIDPPYNTGARDWKYNNRIVDNNDAWRHSKWLAMMEKRLKLVKKLLKPDGVLIVTIDEHEVHHLGLLLEGLFPDAYRQVVTIVINSAGNTQGAFYRVEEYALFCFSKGVRPDELPEDLLSDETKRPRSLWSTHIRSGGINDLPSRRPNLVFPIGVDPERLRVVGCGPSLEQRLRDGSIEVESRSDLDMWRPDTNETYGGYPVVWPFSIDGSLGTWRNEAKTVMELSGDGFLRVSANPNAPGSNQFSIAYITDGHRRKIASGEIPTDGREPGAGPVVLRGLRRQVIPKTVWKRKAHDATNWGSPMLRALVGPNSFKYPKSPYAVADALATVVSSRPDAIVLDFFAGSGTTLHSVALLNAQDGGNRSCIMVTNNDVSEYEAKRLSNAGHFAGDPDYESHGIFESVTKPRVKAAITGIRPDGKSAEGKYLDQYLPDHAYADGFEENVAFFRMDYLDPDLVELGRQFNAVAPLLWLAAGSVGPWEEWDGKAPWSAPASSTYAVLFDLAEAAAFTDLVEALPEISHAWIVTDSHAAYIEASSELRGDVQTGQLYVSYLRNFTVNAPGVLD